MPERYDPFDGAGDSESGRDDCPYAWISEWLCEYVDGTMDPSMQAVFEEYLDANPELDAHVERLCRTRTLLSECECRQAAERAKERLHRAADASAEEERTVASSDADVAEIEAQIEALLAEENDANSAAQRPRRTRTVIAAASAMTLMLGVGLFAGAMLFAERAQAPSASSRTNAIEQAAPDRPPVASGRHSTAASDWGTPLHQLKKMPMQAADSIGHTAGTASSRLLQQAGLNPQRP